MFFRVIFIKTLASFEVKSLRKFCLADVSYQSLTPFWPDEFIMLNRRCTSFIFLTKPASSSKNTISQETLEIRWHQEKSCSACVCKQMPSVLSNHLILTLSCHGAAHSLLSGVEEEISERLYHETRDVGVYLVQNMGLIAVVSRLIWWACCWVICLSFGECSHWRNPLNCSNNGCQSYTLSSGQVPYNPVIRTSLMYLS